MPVQADPMQQIFLMQQCTHDIRYDLRIWHRTDQPEAVWKRRKWISEQCYREKYGSHCEISKKKRCEVCRNSLCDKSHITGYFCLMVVSFFYSIHFLFSSPNVFNSFMFNLHIHQYFRKKSLFWVVRLFQFCRPQCWFHFHSSI